MAEGQARAAEATRLHVHDDHAPTRLILKDIDLMRSVVFLGTGGLSTGSGGWIQLGALGSFLERNRHRYAALFDSNFVA